MRMASVNEGSSRSCAGEKYPFSASAVQVPIGTPVYPEWFHKNKKHFCNPENLPSHELVLAVSTL